MNSLLFFSLIKNPILEPYIFSKSHRDFLASLSLFLSTFTMMVLSTSSALLLILTANQSILKVIQVFPSTTLQLLGVSRNHIIMQLGTAGSGLKNSAMLFTFSFYPSPQRLLKYISPQIFHTTPFPSILLTLTSPHTAFLSHLQKTKYMVEQ